MTGKKSIRQFTKRIPAVLTAIILLCSAVLPANAAQQLSQEPELYYINVLSLTGIEGSMEGNDAADTGYDVVNSQDSAGLPFFTATFYEFPDAGDVLLTDEDTLHEMIGDDIYYAGGIDGEAPYEYQGVRLYDVAEIMKKTRVIGSFNKRQQLLVMQSAASLDGLRELIESTLNDSQINLSYYNEHRGLSGLAYLYDLDIAGLLTGTYGHDNYRNALESMMLTTQQNDLVVGLKAADKADKMLKQLDMMGDAGNDVTCGVIDSLDLLVKPLSFYWLVSRSDITKAVITAASVNTVDETNRAYLNAIQQVINLNLQGNFSTFTGAAQEVIDHWNSSNSVTQRVLTEYSKAVVNGGVDALVDYEAKALTGQLCSMFGFTVGEVGLIDTEIIKAEKLVLNSILGTGDKADAAIMINTLLTIQNWMKQGVEKELSRISGTVDTEPEMIALKNARDLALAYCRAGVCAYRASVVDPPSWRSKNKDEKNFEALIDATCMQISTDFAMPLAEWTEDDFLVDKRVDETVGEILSAGRDWYLTDIPALTISSAERENTLQALDNFAYILAMKYEWSDDYSVAFYDLTQDGLDEMIIFPTDNYAYGREPNNTLDVWSVKDSQPTCLASIPLYENYNHYENSFSIRIDSQNRPYICEIRDGYSPILSSGQYELLEQNSSMYDVMGNNILKDIYYFKDGSKSEARRSTFDPTKYETLEELSEAYAKFDNPAPGCIELVTHSRGLIATMDARSQIVVTWVTQTPSQALDEGDPMNGVRAFPGVPDNCRTQQLEMVMPIWGMK